jgi:hypothetical protein
VRFPNFKVVQTGSTMYPETNDETIAQVMTTLSEAAVEGATAIKVTSIGPGGAGTKQLRVGDAIGIDMAGNFEMNKITGVMGTGPYKLELAQPLAFAHPSEGTSCPVIQGGIGIVLGDGVGAPDCSFVHLEGLLFGVDCGNVRAARFGGENDSTFFVRASGSLIGARFDTTIMSGSKLVGNNLVCKPSYAYGSEDAENLIIGPITKSYLSFIEPPVILPVNEKGEQLSNYSAWETRKPIGVPHVKGQWYPNYAITSSTLLLSENDAYCYPFIVTDTHAYSEMRVNCTAGGGAGSVLRFGIYADNGTGYPGLLVKEFGAVSATEAKAIVVTAAVTLAPGVYWLTIAAQGSASTPTLTTDASGIYPLLGSPEPGKAAVAKRCWTIGSGAFPKEAHAEGTANAPAPIISIKA